MMNPNMSGLQPGVILLREGTDTSQGVAQLVSNINACQAVAEAVRTTLGPSGMDKLIHDGRKVRRDAIYLAAACDGRAVTCQPRAHRLPTTTQEGCHLPRRGA